MSAASDSVFPPDAGEAPRIRFLALRTARSPRGRSHVEVDLRRLDGEVVTGVAEEDPSVFGDQRAAAMATVQALSRANTGGRRFELLGVKNVRAFDQTVVLVQVAVTGGGAPPRLVGSSVGDEDLVGATVRAVLNASNRVLWMPSDARAPGDGGADDAADARSDSAAAA